MNTLKTMAVIPIALVTMIAGGALASYASVVAAQTTDQAAQTTTTPAPTDPGKGGHIGKNGVKEELLTGTQASSATQAALVAVPGGTVERVETDAEGATYEAHMVKADGTHVTVKFDANFNVTSIEDGPTRGSKEQQ